jgi:hypothetical protein
MTNKRPLLERRAENLCMMGDMGHPSSNALQDLLAEASEGYRHVFMLAGRCEYGRDEGNVDTDALLTEMCKKYRNVNFLQKSSVTVRPDLVVAGSTLRLWPRDGRYAGSFVHLLDELCIKGRNEGKKVLYLSYGLPDKHHSAFIEELRAGSLVTVDWDTAPPEDPFYI